MEHALRSAKITLLLLIILAPLLCVAPAPVNAQSTAPDRSNAGKDALNFLDKTAEKAGLGNVSSGEDSTLNLIGNIINVALGFVGIIFFVQVFWAGFKWMTSQGNEEAVKDSKATIKTAVIGIAVVFTAFLITNFVLNQIGKITTEVAPSGACVLDEECDEMTQEECNKYDDASWEPNATCNALLNR